MPAPPAKSSISGTPTNAVANGGFAAFWDYVTGLLGMSGNAADARTALGAAAESHNHAASEITTGDLAAARIANALNASGSAPLYACRAWVSFNGQGTVAIRAAGNVLGITDNGVGSYTVNLSTAMPDGNYAAVVTTTVFGATNTYASKGASAVPVRTFSTAGALTDYDDVNVAVFR